MKYRAKNDFHNSFTKGKVYNVEDVSTIGFPRYRCREKNGVTYMGQQFLNKYFEKVEEDMKFKVGDKVVIKKSLEVHKKYGENSISKEMLKYLGKSAIIVDIHRQQYALDIDKGYWSWTDEMLEPVQDKLRICEIIGKEVGEKFNIKGYEFNPCFINNRGCIYDACYCIPDAIFLLNIIKNPDLIESIPQWTDKEKEVFNALKVLGFKYIARDKDNRLYAFTSKPKKYSMVWGRTAYEEMLNLNKELFTFLKWEDEPFETPTIEEDK